MLKQLVHSNHGKLHTFDDFYNNNNSNNTKTSKTIKSRSSSNDLISSTNNTNLSPTPTSPCSPNSNPYTFYNIFSDYKSSTTPDVVIEEDETEQDDDIPTIEPESHPPTPVFYLEDDHHHPPQSSSSSASSPHWPSLILNRFRHSNSHNHGIVKQNSVNDSHMNSAKIRKNEHSDSSINKHRFLKRSETINNTNGLNEKRSSNDDFPELSLPTNNNNNNIVKKHRSFVSLFHHFHHPNHHHHHHHQTLPKKNPNKSSSTGTLHTEDVNPNPPENSRPKLMRQKTVPASNEMTSPVKKSPSTPILPKLASLFHRHHLSEHHKHRVGNLKARLHHRRNSPPLTTNAPKFQCQVSNELIEQIKQSEQQNLDACPQSQRPVKPVIMKRVHTWHNTFDLRPLDQCLEY